MRSRDVVIGFIFLLILVFGIVYSLKKSKIKPTPTPLPTPTIEQKIESTFGGMRLPNDVDRVELKDVEGGQSYGIATPTEVLANLPDPAAGTFYQVWIVRNGEYVALGKMRVAKGGYLFEGNIGKNKVVVSREKIYDNRIEQKVLE